MLKELTQAYVAAFAAKDLDGCAALMHETFVLEDPVVVRVEGKQAALDVVAGIFKSIDSLGYRARNIFVDGNTSLIEFVLEADGQNPHRGGCDRMARWQNAGDARLS